MESVKTIRAVERAFAVLRALQEARSGATLAELQAATRLSGPTVLRLLKTLQGVHAVRRGLYDQRWRNSLRLDGLTRGLSAVERLADIAAPWLDDLCAQVRWPSDLAVHFGDDDSMTVLESTLRQSAYFVRRSAGAVRVNLLMSAVGTAFLSQLPPTRCRSLVDAARAGADCHNKSAIAAGDLQRRLVRAREAGYASRHQLYLGGPYNGEAADDRLASIAVPLACDGRVYGAVNINWNRRAMTEARMVESHLAQLQAVAAGILTDAASHGLLQRLEGEEARPCATRG